MPAFTVEKCEAANTFKNDYGEFQVWKVQIHDGEKSLTADLNTKLGKSGPTIGERIEGDLTKGPYGWKLKRAAQNGGGGGGGPRTEDPKKSAEIRRMASHKVAVELLGIEVQVALARASRGEASTLLDAITNAGASTVLPRRIEWFEGDAKAAGDRA